MSEHPILFLSHSGVDTQTAYELKRRLLASPDAKAAGPEIWLDKDNLAPGRGWQEQLEKVITTGSTAFAVIVGINWVDREIRVALSRATSEKNYPFIPVFVSQDSLSTLPPFASQFHGVHDPIKNEEELSKLLRIMLGGLADQDGTGKRRPVKLTDSLFVGLRAMTEADADLFPGIVLQFRRGTTGRAGAAGERYRGPPRRHPFGGCMSWWCSGRCLRITLAKGQKHLLID